MRGSKLLRVGAVGATVVVMVAGSGGVSVAAPGGRPGPPSWVPGDVRAHIPPGAGSGKKAPKHVGPPEWVKQFVAARKYTAPTREKIRRDAPGFIPKGEKRWTEDGTQSGARAGAGVGGGGVGGTRGMIAPRVSLAAAVDDSVATPGLGLQPHYAVEEFGVREHMSAGVNLANGNLVVRDTDLKINAPGLATQSDRFYNGLSSRSGVFGQRWSMAGGQDVGLEIGSTTVTFRGPSGFRATFTGSGSSWTAPAWFRGKLVKQTDGSWTLTQGPGKIRVSSV